MIRRDDARAFDEAWENGVPAKGEVGELVRAAELLCEQAVAAPAPDFRASLRERLMTEAATVLVEEPVVRAATTAVRTPARRPARRRLAGFAAATIASVGTVSLVATSAQALPGDALYPVKLGVENVQLSLKGDGADRGAYELDRASERLREAQALAADGRGAQMAQLFTDFARQTREGSESLFDAYAASGDDAAVETFNRFADKAAFTLSGLAADGKGIEDVEQAWTSAAETLDGLASESSRLCGSCRRADTGGLIRAAAAPGGQGGDSAPRKASPSRSGGDTTEKPSTAAPSRPAPSASAPSTTAPSTSSPVPSVTPRPQGLRGVTDPLLGGLLGNEEKEGLVPGILGGLLGSGEKK